MIVQADRGINLHRPRLTTAVGKVKRVVAVACVGQDVGISDNATEVAAARIVRRQRDVGHVPDCGGIGDGSGNGRVGL